MALIDITSSNNYFILHKIHQISIITHGLELDDSCQSLDSGNHNFLTQKRRLFNRLENLKLFPAKNTWVLLSTKFPFLEIAFVMVLQIDKRLD